MCLREPSLARASVKGAAGALPQVIPMGKSTWHFTGDFHAIRQRTICSRR